MSNINDRRPLVSVIVPTYRRNVSLKNAIESLYTQDYKNIEIVVIDDNADYEWNIQVKTIIDSFKDKCNIVYICNATNKGSANTRNIGIDVAKGEYITFLDDDDLYLNEKVSKQLESMLESGADYSISDASLFNERGELLEHRSRNYLKRAKSEDLLKYHLMYHMAGTNTMMFRKQYLLDIGCFEPIEVGDDYYLMEKAIKAKGNFCYLNGSYVKAFVHTGEEGLSSGESKIIGENNLYESKKIYFDKLDSNSINYIKMRHYAIIGFAYYRLKNYYKFLLYGFKSFFVSPRGCINLILDRKKL